MVAVSYPGVYVEEIPSGAKVIQAAGTSTAAFFGVAEKGPIGTMEKIFSFAQYQEKYGGYVNGYYLAHSVYQFFNNGGTQCYIGRVAPGADTADISLFDQASSAQVSLTVSAISAGVWANKLQLAIDAPANSNFFGISVHQEDDTGTAESTALEVFSNLSMNPASNQFVEKVVNRDSNLIRVSINTSNNNEILGYSESGEIDISGSPEFLAAHQRQLKINIAGDGIQNVDIATALNTGSVVTTPVAEDAAASSLADIAAALQHAIRQLTPVHDSTPANVYQVTVSVENGSDADHKKLKIEAGGTAADGSKVEISMSSDSQKDMAAVLNLGNGRGTELFGSYQKRPKNTVDSVDPDNTTYHPLGDAVTSASVSDVHAGTDGNLPPQDTDYINAFHWLDPIADVSLISVPGVGSPALFDAGMNYCKTLRPLSDCFYIGEMTEQEDELSDITAPTGYLSSITAPNSYGAIYYPWLKMADPTGASSTPIAVPPSGFIAGLYARIDGSRGVWKAAAGTEATISGTVGLISEMTDIEQGNVNNLSKSVCVIRKFPNAGIVSWGARTVSNDPEYKYIPIRRTAIMLRKSIYDGIQWAVFEPNDHRLWAALKLNIDSFMNGLFRAGAFQGEKASDAYFVRCGLGDTMTQGDIDLGKVIVKIGFAPLKPAEFVIVTIEQIVGQQ